jgi:hypothetical protein
MDIKELRKSLNGLIELNVEKGIKHCYRVKRVGKGFKRT